MCNVVHAARKRDLRRDRDSLRHTKAGKAEESSSNGFSRKVVGGMAGKEMEREAIIDEWRRRYSSVGSLERYIREELSDGMSSQLMQSQGSAIPVLARLGLLKDSMESLVEQYSTLYRWVWQYKSTMEVDGDACFMSKYVWCQHVSQGLEGQ